MLDSEPEFPIPTAFVDNWETLHNDIYGLKDAQERSEDFCNSWK